MTLLFVLILGASIGSFLGVLAERLPKGESITGRSHCDSCGKQLGVFDLIPLLSYLSHGGKCGYCQHRIPERYFHIEVLTMLLFALVWNTMTPDGTFQSWMQLLVALWIVSVLSAILFADSEYQIIPDSLQIAFGFGAIGYVLIQQPSVHNILMHVGAGIIIMVPILLLFLITKGKGMGFGDVKFAFIMGLLLGIIQGFLALYIAFISGAVVGVWLLVTRKKHLKSKIAFGPFLVAGTIVMLLYGDQIVLWVKGIYGLTG